MREHRTLEDFLANYKTLNERLSERDQREDNRSGSTSSGMQLSDPASTPLVPKPSTPARTPEATKAARKKAVDTLRSMELNPQRTQNTSEPSSQQTDNRRPYILRRPGNEWGSM